MSMVQSLSHLTNPLCSIEQLTQTGSRSDGVPQDIEDAIKHRTSCLIQATGILLRLPQHIVAETIVIFARFWMGPGGGSLLRHDAKDIAAGCLYLVTKPGPYPLSPRQILDAFFYVIHASDQSEADTRRLPIYTEGAFQTDRAALVRAESQVLLTLGHQTHVALPHALCINYLQTLGAVDAEEGHDLARRAYAHLNSILVSPQLVYLTHQPNALTVAAIYLAARECMISLPEGAWWEVFDVDRETLGFLVVALTSMPSYVEAQERDYGVQGAPLTIQGLKSILSRARLG